MNNSSNSQNQPVMYDVDYSFYLQRGRQEQARAMREVFAGLFRRLHKKTIQTATTADDIAAMRLRHSPS